MAKTMFTENNGEVVLGKWLSLLQHVSNHHDHFDNDHVQQCSHGPLDDNMYEWIEDGKFISTELQ